METEELPSLRDRIRGCLLGGAIGDALGAPVEFLKLDEIRRRFGPTGITAYAPAYGRVGAITDDTQMTMFTAEGLIRACVRSHLRGICGVPGVVFHAYLRWLLTQNYAPPGIAKPLRPDGWLFNVQAMHSQRAPGNTCLSALMAAEDAHGPPIAWNNSKGCGGIMRVAPSGLLPYHTYQQVFDDGAAFARLTHGHPTGYLAAGYFAVLIAALARGESWDIAFSRADAAISKSEENQETLNAVAAARALADAGRPTAEAIETLGGGWTAEEALAITVCCALTAEGFSDAIVLAANHSGDSDSTASMTGQLIGAKLGFHAIDKRWLNDLELKAEILQLCDDFVLIASKPFDANVLKERYPGW